MLYIPNVVPQGLQGCLQGSHQGRLQGRLQDSSKSWAKPSGSLRRIGVLIFDVLDLERHGSRNEKKKEEEENETKKE